MYAYLGVQPDSYCFYFTDPMQRYSLSSTSSRIGTWISTVQDSSRPNKSLRKLGPKP